MAEQKIELRKIRDFGENLSDTFGFIRQHAGPLLKSFLAISAIFIIAQGISTSIYQSHITRVFRGVLTSSNPGIEWIRSIFNLNYFMIIFMSVLTITSMQIVLSAYMKYYIENGTKPSIQEVWELFKRYFFKVLLFKTVVYLSLLVAVFFCLFPALYLAVVLAPLPLVAVIEDKGLTESYQRCFELIKENFWSSLGLYIVAYILYLIAAGIIGGSLSIAGWLAGYLTTSDLDIYMIGINSFFKSFSYIFYVILFVCIAMNYFSLVEKKDATGLLSRIDTIGGTDFTGSKETDEAY